MVTLSLVSEAGIYSGEETACSVNGAGELDRSMYKYEIRKHHKTIQNKKIKMD